jgi:hypothetical protein
MICNVKNPSNAFVYIELNDSRIIIDPWVKSGLYYGGWSLFPEPESQDEILKNATHLYITHLHEDHCDPHALSKLNKKVKAYIPNIFASHVLKKKLQDAGIEDVILLDCACPSIVADGITFEVIPPMNGFGQEVELYKGSDSLVESIAIDTGLIVSSDEYKLIFLADNTPYLFNKNKDQLNRMTGADLLAFPYNGAASDYPICYSNIDDIEMLDISNKREAKRELALLGFFKAVSPKVLMPYSSDFAVIGKAASRFAKLSECWWSNKKMVADRYNATTGLPAVALYSGDSLTLSKDSDQLDFALSRGKVSAVSLEEFSRSLVDIPPLTEKIFKYSGQNLHDLTLSAADHMFKFMSKFNIKSDWIFLISINDLSINIPIDMDLKSVVKDFDNHKKILNVKLNSGFYEALLTGKAHWNNAQLSFQLEWSRVPNIYSHDLYAALNFFHAPRGA